MLKKIAKGYGNLLGTVGKLGVLLVVCAILGCAVVFPLWKFATSAPKIYTTVVLVCMIFAALIFFVKRAKSVGIRQFLASVLKFVVFIGGIVAIIALVLAGKRFFAIPALILTVALYGIVSFGFGRKSS